MEKNEKDASPAVNFCQ